MKKIQKNLTLILLTFIFALCSFMLLTPYASADAEIIEPEKKVTIYQLAPENQSLMQSYVIKTPNNKIVVVDGGIDGTGKTASPYLPSAIRAILGLGQTDVFEIDAWFISHAHTDHFYELSKMLNAYNADSNWTVNNFYFDFPTDFSWIPAQDYDNVTLQEFKTGLNTYATANDISYTGDYYDQLNASVINATAIEEGLTLTVDGVDFEILQTWANTDGQVNDNSLVFKMVFGDQSVMFLNDIAVNAGNRLVATYAENPEVLKADVVQMAHHGQNGADKNVYDSIGASAHLWATPSFVWDDTTNTYPIDTVRGWVGATTSADKNNLVACLYDSYPTDPTKVEDWKTCVDGMKMEIPHYESSFASRKGASIRATEGSTGIRFSAILDSYDSDATYGFVIVPSYYLNGINGDYVTNLINKYGRDGIILLSSTVRSVSNHFEIQGSIANIKYKNINLDFVGIPYSLKDGVYTYADFDIADITRSVANVAVSFKNDYIYNNNQELADKITVIDGFIKSSINQKNGVLESNNASTTPVVTFAFADSSLEIENIGVATDLGLNSSFDIENVLFSSSDESIATVKDGKVTMHKLGTAVITAKCADYTATCSATYSFNLDEGYLAQFDNVGYESLVTLDEYWMIYSNVNIEYLPTFGKENDVLKVEFDHTGGNFGIVMNLPKAMTNGSFTLRYYLSDCLETGTFVMRNESYLGADLLTIASPVDTWNTVSVSGCSDTDTIYFLGYVPVAGKFTVYFSAVADGNVVDKVNQDALAKKYATEVASLADGYLADFDNAIYQEMVSIYNDYGTISENTYLESFAGEVDVLKVKVTPVAAGGGFIFTLPKAKTGNTYTVRYYIESGNTAIAIRTSANANTNVTPVAGSWQTVAVENAVDTDKIVFYCWNNSLAIDATTSFTVYLSAIADGNVVDKVTQDANNKNYATESASLADGYLADFDNAIYQGMVSIYNSYGTITENTYMTEFAGEVDVLKVTVTASGFNAGIAVALPKAMTSGTMTLRYYLVGISSGAVRVRNNPHAADLATLESSMNKWTTVTASGNTDNSTVYIYGYVPGGTMTIYLSAIADGNVVDKVTQDAVNKNLSTKLNSEATTLTNGYLADFDNDVYTEFAMVNNASYRNADSITSEIVSGGFQNETNVLKVTTTNNSLGIGDILIKLPKACTTGMTVKLWVGELGGTDAHHRFWNPDDSTGIQDISADAGWQILYLDYTAINAKDTILIQLQCGAASETNTIYFAFVQDGDTTGDT